MHSLIPSNLHPYLSSRGRKMAKLWQTTAWLFLPLTNHEKNRREKPFSISCRHHFLELKKGNFDAIPIKRTHPTLPRHSFSRPRRAHPTDPPLPATHVPGRNAHARPIHREHTGLVAQEHAPRQGQALSAATTPVILRSPCHPERSEGSLSLTQTYPRS